MSVTRDTEILCGVDEVGRGSAAGDIFAAACILPCFFDVPLRDSKKLSPRRREELSALIRAKALDWSIGRVSIEEIAQLNVHKASLLAMERAVGALIVKADQVVVDGKYPIRCTTPCKSIIGGDDLVPAISAASIIAKVERDAYMNTLHALYPEYKFDTNKGYMTEAHISALMNFGPCPVHRIHYRPVQRALQATRTQEQETLFGGCADRSAPNTTDNSSNLD